MRCSVLDASDTGKLEGLVEGDEMGYDRSLISSHDNISCLETLLFRDFATSLECLNSAAERAATRARVANTARKLVATVIVVLKQRKTCHSLVNFLLIKLNNCDESLTRYQKNSIDCD